MFTTQCLTRSILISLALASQPSLLWAADNNLICQQAESNAHPIPALLPTQTLPDDVFEAQTKIRPCIKSYPWPEGKFFVDRPKDGDSEALTSVSADEMLELMKKNNELAALYSKLGINKYLEATTDSSGMQAIILGVHLSEGMSVPLLEKYGAFLYLWKLNKEGDAQKALSFANQYISRHHLSAETSANDLLEELTFFSNQSLSNLIILSKYTASAALAQGTLKDQQDDLLAFSKIRTKLTRQTSLIKDPYPTLYENAGCGQP